MNNNDIVNQPVERTFQQGELYQDACSIIEQAQVSAYRSVNETIIKRNWLLGLRIQHEVLKGQRAEYGEQVIKNLAYSSNCRVISSDRYSIAQIAGWFLLFIGKEVSTFASAV